MREERYTMQRTLNWLKRQKVILMAELLHFNFEENLVYALWLNTSQD